MISDLWTLEPDGEPGSAATLAALGVVAATLERASQSAAVLSLSWARGDGLTCDWSAYAWESRWVLRRDGEVYFRGRVATPARRSGDAGGERVSIALRDAWWDLERTPYTQEWAHCTASALGVATTSRARLCLAADGERETTAEALATVLAAAAAAGTWLALDVSGMTPLTPPPIEGLDRMCSQLAADLLRWHPECAAWIEPGEAGDTLVVRDLAAAPVVTVDLGAAPLAALDLARRDDLVVDSVHVHYESEIPRSASVVDGDADAPETIRVRPRLAVHSDVWPRGAAVTRRSMVLTIPVPSAPAASPPAPPEPHRQPVKTRPLPATGDYDAPAEKFWLKALRLESLGLGPDDIKLPTTTVGDIAVHTVAFAHPEDDPDDPLFEQPSAINPASKPLWRPPSVADFPRYLVSGQLAEWMKVEAAEVVCTATVAVKKSSVDALGDRDKAVFMALEPRSATVQSIPAYLVEARAVVVATTAKTRVYKNYPAAGTGDVAADNSAAHAAALDDAVIPGLAEALYVARSSAPWEGSVDLSAEEAGATRHLGSVLRLVHADRSDWTAMRALVQSESLDLASGSARVGFGPADHLSPQDFIALHQAAHPPRGDGAPPPPPRPPAADEEDGSEDEPDLDGGVYPPTVAPVREVSTVALGGAARWDLAMTDTDEVKVARAGQIKRTSALDGSGAISIDSVGSSFAVADGDFLVLEIERDLTTTLNLRSTWDGYPMPVDTEESTPGGVWVMTKYYFPLWYFSAAKPDTDGTLFGTVWGRKLCPDSDFQIIVSREQDADGHVVSSVELRPAAGYIS